VTLLVRCRSWWKTVTYLSQWDSVIQRCRGHEYTYDINWLHVYYDFEIALILAGSWQWDSKRMYKRLCVRLTLLSLYTPQSTASVHWLTNLCRPPTLSKTSLAQYISLEILLYVDRLFLFKPQWIKGTPITLQASRVLLYVERQPLHLQATVTFFSLKEINPVKCVQKNFY
jgi:hypothetical protein